MLHCPLMWPTQSWVRTILHCFCVNLLKRHPSRNLLGIWWTYWQHSRVQLVVTIYKDKPGPVHNRPISRIWQLQEFLWHKVHIWFVWRWATINQTTAEKEGGATATIDVLEPAPPPSSSSIHEIHNNNRGTGPEEGCTIVGITCWLAQTSVGKNRIVRSLGFTTMGVSIFVSINNPIHVRYSIASSITKRWYEV